MFTKLRIRYHRLSVFTWKDNGVQYFFLNLKWSNFIMIVCKTVAQRLSDKIFLLQRALGHTWHQVSPIGEKNNHMWGRKHLVIQLVLKRHHFHRLEPHPAVRLNEHIRSDQRRYHLQKRGLKLDFTFTTTGLLWWTPKDRLGNTNLCLIMWKIQTFE